MAANGASFGTALDARNLTREFKRHLANTGLPESLRFYDMRHAAASILVADGLPITAVSAMLGHALTSTTLNTYAHVLPGTDRLTAEAMERLLGWVAGTQDGSKGRTATTIACVQLSIIHY